MVRGERGVDFAADDVPDNWNFNGSNPCLHHGGNYNQNQNHGPFYVNYNSASNTNSNIGCRLLEADAGHWACRVWLNLLSVVRVPHPFYYAELTAQHLLTMSRQDTAWYTSGRVSPRNHPRRWNGCEATRRILSLMKRVRVYQQILSEDNLRLAIREVNRGHRRNGDHSLNKKVLEIEANMDAYVAELRRFIEDLVSGDAHIMRSMDKYCIASVPGRGNSYGVKAIKKWMNGDAAGTRYGAECDIYHCFEELDPPYVIQALKRLFKDRETLWLCDALMEYGVLIGAFFSAWFLHLVLQPLDLMIHQREYGVSHYLRQMDNFTIFASSKRKLRKLIRDIQAWLADVGLKLKDNWQVFRIGFTPRVEKAREHLPEVKRRRRRPRIPSALGYRFGHGYTILRKHNLFRLKQSLHLYYYRRDRNQVISFKRASGLISRLGQLRKCDCQRILERYYQPKTMFDLKKVVRKECRRLQKLYPPYQAA